MAKEERIQLRVTKETKEAFQSLMEYRRLNPNEMFIELLDSYRGREKKYEKMERLLYEQEKKLEIMYQYITLQVKGNPNLPTDEDKMKKFVNAESRFKKFIEAKEKKK